MQSRKAVAITKHILKNKQIRKNRLVVRRESKRKDRGIRRLAREVVANEMVVKRQQGEILGRGHGSRSRYDVV